MDEPTLDSVKDEIRFFMEKVFQISFGYLGALAGMVAVARIDGVEGLAVQLGTSKGVVLAVFILFINGLYLSVAVACLFAILKRGYFIIESTRSLSGNQRNIEREWELYVRSSQLVLFRSKRLNDVAWNLDNYYMIPFFAAILVISLCAVIYPWHLHSALWIRLLSIAIFAGNLLLPILGALSVQRLGDLCRQTEKSTPN